MAVASPARAERLIAALERRGPDLERLEEAFALVQDAWELYQIPVGPTR